MKTVILFVYLSFCAVSVNAQDPCKMMGQKNPHGMDIKVSSFSSMDTMNFMVTTMNPLPFTVKVGDTVWFHVCMMAKDGKMHSTQIKYMTDMGQFSYNISMQAPTAGVAYGVSERALVVYPNPAVNSISVTAPNLTETASLDFYSVSGTRLLSRQITSSAPTQISLGAIPSGFYLVKLVNKGVTVGETRLTVTH